jgi:hypothetical protein
MQFSRHNLFKVLLTFLVINYSVASNCQEHFSYNQVLVGATIIDGISDTPLVEHSLLIQNDKILEIVPSNSQILENADIVDLEGKFIIPGLIDSHVHWLDWMGELFINHGITSIVALTDLDRNKRINSQKSHSLPRMYHTGGRPAFNDNDNSDEIRRAIQEWLKNEPDLAHFNTYNDQSGEAFRMAAREVHRHNFLIFGHTENAVESIENGHDIIEHVWGFTQAAMTQEELDSFQNGEYLTWATFMSDDWEELDQMIVDAVDKGIYINPTLVYEWGGMSEYSDQREMDDYRVLRNPDLVYFPDNIANSLLAKHRQIKNFSNRYENMPYVKHLSEVDRQEFEEGYRNVLEFLRRFVNAGGKIQAGTDTVSGGMPGLSVHQEMQMLVEAGISPMQAIKSATRWSAELLEGRNGALGPAEIGSIEPGKFADLVVLDADPLDDIRNTQKINGVMKNGQWVTPGYHPEYYTFTRPSRSIAGSTFAPVVSSISPAYVIAGHQDTRVVLEGSGFQMITLVRVNDISVKTHFVNPRRLEIDIPASLLASPRPDPYSAPGPYQNTGIVGFRSVEVHAFNPPPEGGTSNSVHLMVRP